MTQFTKYQHLERLGTEEVEGIQTGIVYVFPKLDGTNASVWMDGQGKIKAGSRNRELSVENDNAGFYNWVLTEEEKFLTYFSKYPNHILYGEWLVPHSLKTYRDDAWRRFWVFDVYSHGDPVPYPHFKELMDEGGFDYLPPIAIIKNGDDESFRKCTEKNVFLIKEGEGVGEGVVLKNYEFENKYGRKTWAKIITNQFKEIHYREMGAPELGGLSDEERIVNKYVTEHLIDKIHAKIVNEMDGWSSKYIPRLLHTVYYDLIQEELWEILKEFKQPKIDFKYLQRLTIGKIKELRKELF